MSGSDRWRVHSGKDLQLGQIDAASTPGAPGDRIATEAVLPGLHSELSELQARLWAEARRSLLVVLQGLDAAGKDGTIKHMFLGVNPLATRAVAFKEPTPRKPPTISCGGCTPTVRQRARSASSTARTTRTSWP